MHVSSSWFIRVNSANSNIRPIPEVSVWKDDINVIKTCVAFRQICLLMIVSGIKTCSVHVLSDKRFGTFLTALLAQINSIKHF